MRAAEEFVSTGTLFSVNLYLLGDLIVIVRIFFFFSQATHCTAETFNTTQPNTHATHISHISRHKT